MSKLLWMIDKDHLSEPGESDRINWGQRLMDARATIESYRNVFGRTLFVDSRCSVIEIPAERKVRWQAYDDDGVLYYEGHMDIEALFPEDEEIDDNYGSELGSELDRFMLEDSGAVHVYYNCEDIAKHKPDFIEKHPKSDKEGWILIYE